jgi:glycosyltransferase involved in cell wall biosynthesis
MKLSLYTALKDCRRQDYPYLEMIKHHLPLVDEIVINEGHSTDGTYESIVGIDPKIKIFRTDWEKPTGEDWWIHFKDEARRRCTGDWCIHLDCDEFIPDWEFAAIRSHLATTEDNLIPVKFYNFYGNYRVYHPDPGSVRWVTRKMIIHRNCEDLEFWGDGSNLKEKGKPFTWETSEKEFTVHHFGAVRNPGRLRQSWWSAGRFRTGRSIRFKPPGWVFNLFPHDWMDSDYLNGLTIYEGPYIKAVQDSPNRFTRDKMKLYSYLLDQKKSQVAAD